MFFDNFCHESGRLLLELMRFTGVDIQVTRSFKILRIPRKRGSGKNYKITERIRFWSSYKESMHG